MEFDNRVPEAPAGGRRSRGFRNHQHLDWLARLEGKTLQAEVTLRAYCHVFPEGLHAISIVDLASGMCGGAAGA
jgi:hypothetical protein